MEEITNNDWNIKQDIGSILSVEIDSMYNYLLDDWDDKKLYCFMKLESEIAKHWHNPVSPAPFLCD